MEVPKVVSVHVSPKFDEHIDMIILMACNSRVITVMTAEHLHDES
jgi:hypothetical protein